MEKTVDDQMNKKQSLDNLLSDENKKGPKTVVKEELVKMKGDPLGLHVPLDDEPTPGLKAHEKIKSRDEIVVERYNPDIELGLTTEEVEYRQMAGMANIGDMGSTKSIPAIIFGNVLTLFNLLTFGIAFWMLFSGVSFFQALPFVTVISLNITIGIIQEIRAKKTIDQLSLLSAPTAIVIRDKDEVEIAITDVVIDEILKLSSGKQIPADAVVRDGLIEVDESLLTGESDPIIKRAGDTLYSGSYVISGGAHAQVTAIGKDIYIQKLTNQAKKYRKPKSDLLNSLRIIIRVGGSLIIPIGAVLFYLMFQQGGWAEYPTIVEKTAGAMIGMIPSGLFLLTSMALAVGVIRLAQNNTLVQELYCIEMLARVDTLCLDKTGTITDGTMSVKSIIEYKHDSKIPLKHLIPAMLNAQADDNLTSQALKERFGTAKRYRHKDIIPFSSARKYSAVQFDRYGTYILGAPEYVMKDGFAKIDQEVEKQSKEGYRVLVVAMSNGDIDNQKVTGQIEPIALIMIEDTIRPDAVETINYFREYGVDVKVISGDNPATVSRIAQRANVENADKYISLEKMTDKEIVRIASRYTVFGRVSPQQKKILIEALKNNGKTVAMTGDGVNDILALKEADTSIAMASGSEAARNVSHLVLLDSNFSSMPKVVAEGRRVINNIQRVSTLFLTKTIFSFLLALIAIIRQGYYPISPLQLSMIEIFMIGIPGFFLALEHNNKQVTGKFLVNIMKSALPGAIVVVINSLIIFGLENALGMTDNVTTTLVVIVATFTSLMVLYRVATPFNKIRRILFFTMAGAFTATVSLIPYMLNLTPIIYFNYFGGTPNSLSIPQILLMVVLIQATYPLMYITSNIVRWVKDFIKVVINKVADMQ